MSIEPPIELCGERGRFLTMLSSRTVEAQPGLPEPAVHSEVFESSFTQGGEWAWCEAPLRARETLESSANVLVEVCVEGKAAAAGLSFSDFEDFLVPVHPSLGPRRLQLAIDREAGTWLVSNRRRPFSEEECSCTSTP